MTTAVEYGENALKTGGFSGAGAVVNAVSPIKTVREGIEDKVTSFVYSHTSLGTQQVEAYNQAYMKTATTVGEDGTLRTLSEASAAGESAAGKTFYQSVDGAIGEAARGGSSDIGGGLAVVAQTGFDYFTKKGAARDAAVGSDVVTGVASWGGAAAATAGFAALTGAAVGTGGTIFIAIGAAIIVDALNTALCDKFPEVKQFENNVGKAVVNGLNTVGTGVIKAGSAVVQGLVAVNNVINQGVSEVRNAVIKNTVIMASTAVQGARVLGRAAMQKAGKVYSAVSRGVGNAKKVIAKKAGKVYSAVKAGVGEAEKWVGQKVQSFWDMLTGKNDKNDSKPEKKSNSRDDYEKSGRLKIQRGGSYSGGQFIALDSDQVNALASTISSKSSDYAQKLTAINNSIDQEIADKLKEVRSWAMGKLGRYNYLTADDVDEILANFTITYDAGAVASSNQKIKTLAQNLAQVSVGLQTAAKTMSSTDDVQAQGFKPLPSPVSNLKYGFKK
ncbi:MAG: hypothetical protein LBI13_07400 [Streptococcaceae bacterium]|jgi:hypothetical protein|nr:hypothetical protein [Streptococcaceae bacterium]